MFSARLNVQEDRALLSVVVCVCVPWSLISGAAGHTQVRVAVTQRGPGFPQRDAESRAAKPLGRSSEVDILH